MSAAFLLPQWGSNKIMKMLVDNIWLCGIMHACMYFYADTAPVGRFLDKGVLVSKSRKGFMDTLVRLQKRNEKLNYILFGFLIAVIFMLFLSKIPILIVSAIASYFFYTLRGDKLLERYFPELDKKVKDFCGDSVFMPTIVLIGLTGLVFVFTFIFFSILI